MTNEQITQAVNGESTSAHNALIAVLAAATDPAEISTLLSAITYAAQQDVVRDIVIDLQDDHDEAADFVTENYLDLEPTAQA